MAVEPKLKATLDKLLLMDLFEVCDLVLKNLASQLEQEALAMEDDEEDEAAEHYDKAFEYANGARQELDGAESHFKSAKRELGW